VWCGDKDLEVNFQTCSVCPIVRTKDALVVDYSKVSSNFNQWNVNFLDRLTTGR
jgi:hypothetical protein